MGARGQHHRRRHRCSNRARRAHPRRDLRYRAPGATRREPGRGPARDGQALQGTESPRPGRRQRQGACRCLPGHRRDRAAEEGDHTSRGVAPRQLPRRRRADPGHSGPPPERLLSSPGWPGRTLPTPTAGSSWRPCSDSSAPTSASSRSPSARGGRSPSTFVWPLSKTCVGWRS